MSSMYGYIFEKPDLPSFVTQYYVKLLAELHVRNFVSASERVGIIILIGLFAVSFIIIYYFLNKRKK